MRRPWEAYFLSLLILLLSVNAIVGGIFMVLRPDGELLGMQIGFLQNVPFPNYFFPGILLLVFLGFFPLLAFIGLVFLPVWKWANYLNLYKTCHWSWAFSLYSGIVLIFWITFQIAVTPRFWLQPVFNYLGLLIIVFTLMPRVIYFYSRPGIK